MACPVSYYKARSRQVYLPKQCGWYDLYTGKHYVGGRTVTADAHEAHSGIRTRRVEFFHSVLPWSGVMKTGQNSSICMFMPARMLLPTL